MLTRQLLRSACSAPRCRYFHTSHASSPQPARSKLPRRSISPVSPWVRVFATTPRHHKDDPQKNNPQASGAKKVEGAETVLKPETAQKSKAAAPSSGIKNDPLLAEKTVSNKEQRKADWAIMKEMTRYLWPKVSCWSPGRMTAC